MVKKLFMIIIQNKKIHKLILLNDLRDQVAKLIIVDDIVYDNYVVYDKGNVPLEHRSKASRPCSSSMNVIKDN